MNDPLGVIEVERGHYYMIEAVLVSGPVGGQPIKKIRGVVRYDGKTQTHSNGFDTLTVPEFTGINLPAGAVRDVEIMRDLGTSWP